MSWGNDDDDFERELLVYSEIEAIPDVQSVPKTIQMYQQRIQTNNNSSIFDADYTLPVANDGESHEVINDEPLLQDEAQVIRVTSGRGRGGRNIFHRPGDPIGTGLPGDDHDVFQQIRKVAPIGYGNEITETAVRAHHKAKGTDQQNSAKSSPKISKSNSPATLKTATPVEPISDKSSPSISKSNSPVTLKNTTPVELKLKFESGSSSTLKQTTIYVSGTSTPSSTSSDVDSSDYFTSQGQIISDSSNGIEESDSESNPPSIITETALPNPNHQVIQTESIPEASRPAPLSELLNTAKRCRSEYKQRQRERQIKEEELASQRIIQELLQQDLMESEMRRMRLSDTSSSSRSTSRSSMEDVPSWRRRTNSPPRYSWGRKNQDQEMLNLKSTLDFPPLK